MKITPTITRRLLVTVFWSLVGYEFLVLIGSVLGFATIPSLISPVGQALVMKWTAVAWFLAVLIGHIVIPRRPWMPWPPPPEWGLIAILIVTIGLLTLNVCGISQPPPEVCAVVGVPSGHFLWAQTPKKATS